MDGWMGGWMDVKAGLRTACPQSKNVTQYLEIEKSLYAGVLFVFSFFHPKCNSHVFNKLKYLLGFASPPPIILY
jgi:hypothetical protein